MAKGIDNTADIEGMSREQLERLLADLKSERAGIMDELQLIHGGRAEAVAAAHKLAAALSLPDTPESRAEVYRQIAALGVCAFKMSANDSDRTGEVRAAFGKFGDS